MFTKYSQRGELARHTMHTTVRWLVAEQQLTGEMLEAIMKSFLFKMAVFWGEVKYKNHNRGIMNVGGTKCYNLIGPYVSYVWVHNQREHCVLSYDGKAYVHSNKPAQNLCKRPAAQHVESYYESCCWNISWTSEHCVIEAMTVFRL